MNFKRMRKLTDLEKSWVKSLSELPPSANQPIAAWLETVFFKEADGRALIIQASEGFAVLFLTNELFNDETKKAAQVSQFSELVSFLQYLHREGYLSINRGKATRDKSMFFIQDDFIDPKTQNGPIVLNAKGEYTDNPHKILDTKKNTIYQGVRFDHDQFDAVLSTCTGSVLVSGAIRQLLEDDQDAPHKTRDSGTVHWNEISVWVAILAAILCLFIYLHYRSTHHMRALSLVDYKQDQLSSRLDSMNGHLEQLASQPYAATVQTKPATHRGIDISRWNGDILQAVDQQDRLSFVICKATQGKSYVDPDFHTNWKLITEKGLIRGAYHFYDASQDPMDQAEHFAKTLGELTSTDIGPILDIEPESIPADFEVDPLQLQVDLYIFLRHVERLSGRKPIIYTDPSFGDQYLTNDKFGQYALWVADYTEAAQPTIPRIWSGKGYKFWQKSASYDLDSHPTDLDLFKGERAEIYRD